MTIANTPERKSSDLAYLLGDIGLGLTKLGGLPTTGLALAVSTFVGSYLATMWAAPIINVPVLYAETVSLTGPTAIAAASGLAFGVLTNLKVDHFVEAGVAIKDVGVGIIKKTAELGQSLGLLKPGETASQKVIESTDEPGENWARMAAHSTLLMMSPIAITSTIMSLGAGVNAFTNSTYVPYALGAVATAAASGFAVYKAVKAAKGEENMPIAESFEKGLKDSMEDRWAAPKKKAQPVNDSPSLG